MYFKIFDALKYLPEMRSSTFTSVRGVPGTKQQQKKAEAKLQLHTEDENTSAVSGRS